MNDLISRQAVNDVLVNACNLACQYSKEHRYLMCGTCPLENAFDALAELPSAEKKGRWSKIDASNTVQCSECFKYFDYVDGLYYLCHDRELPNYCPNCGAKMERKEE